MYQRHTIRATVVVSANRSVTIEFSEGFQYAADADRVAEKLAALIKEAARS